MRIAMLLSLSIFALACSNLPPDQADAFKAYPNPYNPTQGKLTIVKTDNSAFSAIENDLIIYDYSLTEIFRANVLPDVASGSLKIYWYGVDKNGNTVVPGLYYFKIMSSDANGLTNAGSMVKIIVQ